MHKEPTWPEYPHPATPPATPRGLPRPPKKGSDRRRRPPRMPAKVVLPLQQVELKGRRPFRRVWEVTRRPCSTRQTERTSAAVAHGGQPRPPVVASSGGTGR